MEHLGNISRALSFCGRGQTGVHLISLFASLLLRSSVPSVNHPPPPPYIAFRSSVFDGGMVGRPNAEHAAGRTSGWRAASKMLPMIVITDAKGSDSGGGESGQIHVGSLPVSCPQDRSPGSISATW